MNRLILVSAAAIALAGCATNPDGTPDCSQAANQRVVIQTSMASADLLYLQAVGFCKDGEPGDKCRNIAAQTKASAITIATIAMLALDARCPR